jgi:hypothetical protein
VELCINIGKNYKIGVYGVNPEIRAISETYKISYPVSFGTWDQIIQALTVIAGQAVTERNVFLLFSGELINGHCVAVLPVHERESLCILDKVKHFL